MQKCISKSNGRNPLRYSLFSERFDYSRKSFRWTNSFAQNREIYSSKKQYDELSKSQRDNWLWITSFKLPLAKFRNELIGSSLYRIS